MGIRKSGCIGMAGREDGIVRMREESGDFAKA